MNGVNPKGAREEYADRLGALMASVAEAAVAGAAVAPALTHKDSKKWPKWRDMCYNMTTVVHRSIRRSVFF